MRRSGVSSSLFEQHYITSQARRALRQGMRKRRWSSRYHKCPQNPVPCRTPAVVNWMPSCWVRPFPCLQAIGKQWGQSTGLETWTNGNDAGPQHEQWRLDTRQELVVMEGGMWHGEGGFRAKLNVGQAGIYLGCYPIRAT